jgi:hypothetical protein
VVFELFIVAMVTMLVFRRTRPRRAMLAGLALAVPALLSLLLIERGASLGLLALATAAVGTSAGLGFLGSLGRANAISPADRRGQTASTYYIACFVGASLPVVGAGALTTLAGPAAAGAAFVALLVSLSIAALTVERRSVA